MFIEKVKEHFFGHHFTRENIVAAFDEMDLDHSGSISFKELRVALLRMGIHMSPQSLRQLWRAIDTDLSGEITTEEFVRLFFEDRGAQHRGSSHHSSFSISGISSRDKEKEAESEENNYFKGDVAKMKRQASARGLPTQTSSDSIGAGSAAGSTDEKVPDEQEEIEIPVTVGARPDAATAIARLERTQQEIVQLQRTMANQLTFLLESQVDIQRRLDEQFGVGGSADVAAAGERFFNCDVPFT